MLSIRRQTYIKALERYGKPAQVNQAIEECADLILALRHFDRSKASVEDVVSEIADVKIMIEQLELIFCREGHLDKVIEEKMRRLNLGLEQ